MITCSKKVLSKLIKESRPCAAGCGNARHIRRRNATSNAVALEVVPWSALTQKQRAAMQARQAKHSKQQCKRYRANTATANCKQATRQAAQQPQPAPLSHRRDPHHEGPAAPRSRIICDGRAFAECPTPVRAQMRRYPEFGIRVLMSARVAAMGVHAAVVAGPCSISRTACRARAGGARGRRKRAGRGDCASGRRERAAREGDARGQCVRAT